MSGSSCESCAGGRFYFCLTPGPGTPPDIKGGSRFTLWCAGSRVLSLNSSVDPWVPFQPGPHGRSLAKDIKDGAHLTPRCYSSKKEARSVPWSLSSDLAEEHLVTEPDRRAGFNRWPEESRQGPGIESQAALRQPAVLVGARTAIPLLLS